MKKVFASVAIIAALIVVVFLVNRKEFDRNDEVQTGQSDRSVIEQKSPLVVMQEKQPETKDESLVKPQMIMDVKPVNETKQSTDTLIETSSAPAAKKEDSSAPVAIPVATQEEAEKLNAEAFVFSKKHNKIMEFSEKGMILVSDDTIKNFSSISISKEYEKIFQKNGVTKTRKELSQRLIPKQWTIDFNTLKGNCDYEIIENGFRITSPDGPFLVMTPQTNVLNTITGISFEISCNTPETKVKAGIEESGMLRPGKVYLGELSGIQEDEFLNFQISAWDHFDQFRAFLEISGDATIHGFRIFKKELKGTTYLEGQISERSVLPDPKKSDYPNCRFTAHFVGNVIKAGEACPKEMVLVMNGFEDYSYIGTNDLSKGDKVICSIVPYDMLSEEEQSVQQADDLGLYTLDNYYVLSLQKISAFDTKDNELIPSSGIFFQDYKPDYISIFDRHINQSIPQEVIQAQSNAISEDLSRVDEMLKAFNDNKIAEINAAFDLAWEKEKEKDPPNYNRVGDCVWRNVDNSFYALPEKYVLLEKPSEISEDVLDCFIALKEACETNGVQLIVSLVPNLYVVSSRVINPDFRHIPDLQMATYVKQLSQIGVETIYTTDSVIQNYNRYPFAFFYPVNEHPFDTTQDVISDMLKERLSRYGISPTLDPSLFSTKKVLSRTYADANFTPDNCDIPDDTNNTTAHAECICILYDRKMISKDSNSEVIVVGNSVMRTPLSSPDSLPSLLSCKMSIPIDWSRVEGSGPFTTILSRIIDSPDLFLKNKKVLIMYFATQHVERYANAMINIKELDRNKTLLDKKKIVFSKSDLISNCNSNIADNSFWETLPQKTLFQIPNQNDVSILTLSLNQISPEYDSSKPSILVIPAVCFKKMKCDMIVNGVAQSIPTSWKDPSFSLLSFEIPPETSSITISARSSTNSVFAIKDIEIWQ